MTDLIERMAHAVNERWFGEIDGAREMVRAALKAAEEAGWVLVPMEPTQDMCVEAAKKQMPQDYKRLVEKEGAEILGHPSPVAAPVHAEMLCYQVWRAMLAARPSPPECDE